MFLQKRWATPRERQSRRSGQFGAIKAIFLLQVENVFLKASVNNATDSAFCLLNLHYSHTIFRAFATSIYQPLLLYDCFKFTFYGLKENFESLPQRGNHLVFLFYWSKFYCFFFYHFTPKLYWSVVDLQFWVSGVQKSDAPIRIHKVTLFSDCFQ